MSRSFKKTPGWCDRSPFAKRQANKRVRKYKGDVSNGRSYKKLYCSWNICDFRFLRKDARWRKYPQRQPDYKARMK